MTRNTHNDLLDHESLRGAVDVPYDNTTSGLTATEVQAAIDEIVADGGGGGLADLITGDSQDFISSLGSWTNSGGTMTRDTSYKMRDGVASLKFVVTTSAQYVELPVSGTFEEGIDYWAVFFISNESTTGTKSLKLEFGVIGGDEVTWANGMNTTPAYPYVGNSRFIAIALKWRPISNTSSVKVRVTNNAASATTWHVGMVRAWAGPLDGVIQAYGHDYTPTTSGNRAAQFSPWGDFSGIQATEQGDLFFLNNDVTAGIQITRSETNGIYYYTEHTPSDYADEGHNIQVGDNYLGLFISEKDSSTIQLYPDVSGGYDIEFKDRGSGKFWYAVNTSGQRVPLSALMTGGIQFVIGGGGSAITTGIKGDIEMPFAGVITANRLFADQTGSIVIDIWKDTYANFPPVVGDSITASAKPTLSSAVKSENTTLSGWTTAFSAGDILRINVDSATTVTRVTLSLRIRRT